MSELFGGHIASGRAGKQADTTPDQSSRSGLRTPRDIVNAREARRRAEEDEQQRKIDLERRRSSERRAAAASITAPRDIAYGTSGVRPAPETASDRFNPQPRPAHGSEPGIGAPVSQTRAPPTQSTSSTYQQQPSAQPTSSHAGDQQQDHQRTMPDSNGMNQPGTRHQRQVSQHQKSGFPQAFERWEMLSSQWEGVTSHWIRVLEIHAMELGDSNDRPTVDHMGRYITDLAAAGANLFHAVVELQRLRASSERKFTKWFQETRQQQQSYIEEIQRLRATAENERSRGPATTGLSESQERQHKEMKREMQIAKEEARRAWEELGRREELEREQQYALRDGHPVFVGGVQVLPSAVVQRGASLRQPDDGDRVVHKTNQPAAGDREVRSDQPAAGGQYEARPDGPSPTNMDPFTQARKGQPRGQPQAHYRPIRTEMPPYIDDAPPLPTQQSQTPPKQARPPASGFYHHKDVSLHDLGRQGHATDAGDAPGSDSDEDLTPYAEQQTDDPSTRHPFRSQQNMKTATAIGDAQSMPPPAARTATRHRESFEDISPVSSEDGAAGEEDDEDDDEDEEDESGMSRKLPDSGRADSEDPDYEGGEYDNGEGWTEMEAARYRLHQQPTRLSDVMEEDEQRSRASHASPTRGR